MYDTKHFFDRHGADWDKTADHNSAKIRTMLLLADLAPHSVVLDVGCGTGVLESYLLEYEPSVILGVDFASGMIAAARQKIQHEAVRFACADIMDISDLLCDCCFLFNTFQHFAEPVPVLEHITGLIRIGGRIMISHTQGKRLPPVGGPKSGSQSLAPAQGLAKLLEKDFYTDVVIDNNAMLLVSGIRR